jgi:hypothetical protein
MVVRVGRGGVRAGTNNGSLLQMVNSLFSFNERLRFLKGQ